MPFLYLKTYFWTQGQLIGYKANVLNSWSSQWWQYHPVILWHFIVFQCNYQYGDLRWIWRKLTYLEKVDDNHKTFRVCIYTVASVSQSVKDSSEFQASVPGLWYGLYAYLTCKPGRRISGIGREHFSKVGIRVTGQKWPVDIDFPVQKTSGTKYLTGFAHLPLTSRGRMSGKCVRGWILGGVGGGLSISTRGVNPKYSATTRNASWVIFLGRRTCKLCHQMSRLCEALSKFNPPTTKNIKIPGHIATNWEWQQRYQDHSQFCNI